MRGARGRNPPRVIIVGGGIGGLTLARSLQTLDIDFLVLEQAPALTQVGAGIQLSPNGVLVLQRLGTGEHLDRIGVEPLSHEFRDWRSGDTVLRTPLKPQVADRFGAPYYHVHRADLLDALVDGLDRERLRLDCRVSSVSHDSDSATVRTVKGEELTGDVVIGADGLHSAVRDQLFRPEAPRPSGYVAWRGLVAAEQARQLGFETRSYIYLGPRLSLVLYSISSGSLFTWIALGKSDDRLRESWSQTASAEEIAAAFAEWHAPTRRLIEGTDRLFATALFDRSPLATWIQGRVALLGDACHAMLPYHAQGAVQAIEDAWVLARCLARQGTVSSALDRYQSLRKDRTERIVAQSRHAEETYHLEDEAAVAARNARYRGYAKGNALDFTPQQTWLFSYDADKAALGIDDAWRALRPWQRRR